MRYFGIHSTVKVLFEQYIYKGRSFHILINQYILYTGSRTESIAVNLGIDHRLGATLVQLEGMAGCAGR